MKKSNYIIKGRPTIYFIILTVLTEDCLFGPDNGITNAYIYYWWDYIAWCVGVIFLTWDKHPRSYFIMSQNNPLWTCGSHFTTWDKNSWGYLIKLWFNSFIVTSNRVISLYTRWTQLEIFHNTKTFPIFFIQNGIAIAYNHHRRDRIVWCVGVIFQRERSFYGVISAYHDITPIL